MTGFTRRRVIGGVAVVGAAVALGARPLLDRRSRSEPDVHPDEALQHIGERHLAANPGLSEADLTAVLGPSAADADPVELLETRADAISAEFEDDAVTSVDGWVLATTEVSIGTLQVLRGLP